MSLFRSDLRPPAILSDEAVERYLDGLRAQLQPDPLFRRRLRGEVMNRFVATREGPRVDRALPRRMGRIGRVVLYASFALALSVSGVMAASQEAVPGDALYDLKRHVESLRSQVVPAHLQDDLAAYVLAQRIQELATLADRGDWDAVAALAVEIENTWDTVSVGLGAAEGRAGGPYLHALDRLVAQLPSEARAQLGLVLATPSQPPRGSNPADREAGRAGGAEGHATSGAATGAGRDGARRGSAGPGDDDERGTGGATEERHELGSHEGGDRAAAVPSARPGTTSGRAPTGPLSGPGGGGQPDRPAAQPSPAVVSTPAPSTRSNEGRAASTMPQPRPTPRSGASSDD